MLQDIEVGQELFKRRQPTPPALKKVTKPEAKVDKLDCIIWKTSSQQWRQQSKKKY